MSQWTKADGARIEIAFDEPIDSVDVGAENAFSISVPEYTFVPGGELVDVPKTVERVENKAGVSANIDLSNGTLADVLFTRGALKLASEFGAMEDLLNTTEGMTVLRNNSKQDDGTDAVTGASWFQFNGVAASTLYISGNSWVGFGVSSEQLKVCRRDTALYSLYRQEGTVGNGTVFLKIRWEGYATYNSTSERDALKWELFLFDDGGIYLNLLDVPESASYLGTSSLTCGSNTYSLPVTEGVAVGYSMTPQDNTGSSWVAAAEEYPVQTTYFPNGSAQYAVSGLNLGAVAASRIAWDETAPPGTAVEVSASLDGALWSSVYNGGAVVAPGTSLEDATIFVKAELSTTDTAQSPAVSNLSFLIQSQEDCYSIVLHMDPKTRFESAAGDITVTYDGSGGLAGEGGSVAAFTETFSPNGLAPKPHQNEVEHIDISAAAVGTLLHVYYTDTQCDHHVELNASAVGVLTHINDL